jgi:hypothetical protein
MPLAPVGAAAPATTLTALRPAAPGASFGAVLDARTSQRASSPPEGTARVASAAVRGLEAVERAQARLDALLEAARSGRTFTPQELIALQSEAYRFSQTVELSAKLVEQGAQAVKQALHAQV